MSLNKILNKKSCLPLNTHGLASLKSKWNAKFPIFGMQIKTKQNKKISVGNHFASTETHIRTFSFLFFPNAKHTRTLHLPPCDYKPEMNQKLRSFEMQIKFRSFIFHPYFFPQGITLWRSLNLRIQIQGQESRSREVDETINSRDSNSGKIEMRERFYHFIESEAGSKS